MNQQDEQLIISYSKTLLQYLLQLKKEKYPDLTFYVRQKKEGEKEGKENPEAKGRLEKGFFFQGSDYILLGFVDKNDPKGKACQLGLQYNILDKNPSVHLHVLFKAETDTRIIQCYQEIISTFGGFKKKGQDEHYIKPYLETDFIKVVEKFYAEDWNKFKDIFEKYGLSDTLLISEEKFQSNLRRLSEYSAVVPQ